LNRERKAEQLHLSVTCHGLFPQYFNPVNLKGNGPLIICNKSKNLKAVFVSGDSMIDERINDGDIAIFNIKQTEGNGIYVVSVGNTLLVKRVDFDHANKTIELISANPAYEPRRYTGSELEEIKIEGRVVACYHRF
jgi:repressor LexA